MSSFLSFFADYNSEVLNHVRFFDPSTTQGLLVLGAIALGIALALIWLIFIKPASDRRRLRHLSRRHHHHHHHDDAQPEASDSDDDDEEEGEEDENDEAGDEPHKKRRRRRRRDHRPRNPTLAETGGLPPIRTEDPPGP